MPDVEDDNGSFTHNAQRYRRIHEGVLTHGTGSSAEQAARFYLEHLLDPAAKRARQVSDKPRTKVHLLISLCGFNPVQTILAHELLAPQRVVLIVSKDARSSIDMIHARVAAPRGPLRPQDIAHYDCDPIDPMDIYRVVKLELDRHDFAALLFYRTIEGCLTQRLAHRWPTLNPDRFDWSALADPAGAKQRYAALTRKLNGRASSAPARLALMTSAMLLAAEADELIRRCGFTSVSDLRALQSLARMRNKSVLAHGFAAVSGDQTTELRGQAADLLHAYWSMRGDGSEVGSRCDRLRFLRTDR